MKSRQRLHEDKLHVVNSGAVGSAPYRGHMTDTGHGFRRGGPATAYTLARELDLDLAGSALVAIDSLALRRLATMLRSELEHDGVRRFGWNDDTYWLVDAAPAVRSQYLAVGNAINFRFWTLHDGLLRPTLGKRGGKELQGSMYMWRSLRQCVAEGATPILSAEFLSRLTPEEFRAIFQDDSGICPIESAIEDRVMNLRDLGDHLMDDWDGQFSNLIQASHNDLSLFARHSSFFRAYDDPLCKLTMVNAIMQSGSGLTNFDQDPLPGIDYELVRQLLRMGILKPRRDIALKLQSGELLHAEESIELRRTALSALIQVSDIAGFPCDVLDNKLWLNRTNCTDSMPVCRQPGRENECPFVGTCAQITEFRMPLEITRYY